jgi:hypothetical protein
MHKQIHHNNSNTCTPQLGKVDASPVPPCCSKCGVSLRGWSSVNHVKYCAVAKAAQHQMQRGCATLLSTPVTVNQTIEPDDSRGYEGEVVSEEESSTTSTGNRNEENKHNGSNQNQIASEISSYLSSLKKFDPSHIVECLHWGPSHQSKTSQSTRVVAKFLRVTMLGDGLSRSHMQAILDFTHDMGGKKAALLPKKINGCWKALTKVFAS